MYGEPITFITHILFGWGSCILLTILPEISRRSLTHRVTTETKDPSLGIFKNAACILHAATKLISKGMTSLRATMFEQCNAIFITISLGSCLRSMHVVVS